MTDGKDKDIVEEVFGRSMNDDERVSALFTRSEQPAQVSLEHHLKCPSGPTESPEDAEHETPSKRTSKNTDSRRRVRAVAIAGFAVLVLIFFAGGYLIQRTPASTKIMPQAQRVNRTETVSPLAPQPLPNVKPEPVPAEIDKNIATVDWPQVINWSHLLDEISATMPKTVQLSVIESGDGSEMLLEGRALSTGAVRSLIDALNTNRQIESAELTMNGIGTLDSEDLLTFSINCCLLSDTKTPGTVDGDHNNSALDQSRLFTPTEAEKFFGSIEPVSEDADCMVKSFLVSPKDALFQDETNTPITKKHAALTLLGGYQDILKAVEKLQNRSQGVWLDSVSIKQGAQTGRLECSMGISIYVAEAAG